MANINPMGGPVGGAPIPMMNNGAVNPQAAAAAAAANAANAANLARQQQVNDSQRGVLNTYIYEYFLRYGMYECARSVIQSGQPVNVQKDGPKGGNNVNGVSEDGMDTDMKDDPDSKHPDDLPPPKLPMPASDSSFLYEWFCLFWDIYNAQRTKAANGNVNQYVAHTQQQLKQQELLRTMRPEGLTQQQYQQMIRMQSGAAMGMPMKPGTLVRTAMANNQNPGMMMHPAKPNQMQRDPSQMDPNRERQSSPASGENAPSPSKRQRPNDFNPNPAAVGMMPNGRPAQGMPSQQMLGGPGAVATQMLTAHNINPAQLAGPQFQNFVNIPPTAQQKSIAAYSQHLQHHHGNQMGTKQPNAAGPQGQGSPMMAPGPDGSTMNYTYNTNGEIPTPNGLRAQAPGNGQAAGGSSNHALQDYQMQLMLLEQQNKKRLMMARQEQDNIGGVPREGQPPGPGAPGGPGVPNGQPFPDASPQTMRTGASPNPTEQMKRGTPQMNNPGIPSPAPEGGPQSRGSPNPAMNFMGNADPNMAPHFFKGADGNMAGGQPMNGMRPPSSHPGQPFNGQMTPQMMAARQAQGQAGQNPQQWQGQNNQMVPQGMQQNQQVQGTPVQRSMPPPSAPVAAAANANNRTTASPQQTAAAPPTPNQSNKAAPKKKKETQAAKNKNTAQKNKPNSNINGSGATPAADNNGDSEQAAPATPITPVTTAGFKPGQNTTTTTAPAPVPAPQAPIAPPQGPDPNSINMDSFPMDFGGPLMGGDGIHTGDVLNDFDFDSFLHDGDGDNQPFDFNGAFTGMEGEIGAE
ncbi:unnamed protein product [Clonostachys rhizophaga]|uniref:LisH domain-containing protein n=1 Tax=Clonostachys rhizophaga TaxID=160324 RepID=A0A9N9VLQ1_9HYPO|nr:unnamed protein product [Clonostachys rhizophaga]